MSMMFRLPDKYVMVFLKKINTHKIDNKDVSDYVKIGQKRISILKDHTVWRDNTFTYTPEEVSYRFKRVNFIFKDFDSGTTVFQWGKTDQEIGTTDIKQKNKERLMDKAMQVNPHDYGLAFVIIAAIAGIAGGAIIMVIAYPSVFPQMMKEVPKAAKVILSFANIFT